MSIINRRRLAGRSRPA